MGLLISPNLLKPCRGATNCGNNGLEPEGGNPLFPITVITAAMFSGNRISCETMFMLPLVQGSSLVSLWWTVTRSKTQLSLSPAPIGELETSSTVAGARQSGRGFSMSTIPSPRSVRTALLGNFFPSLSRAVSSFSVEEILAITRLSLSAGPSYG